MGSHARVHVHPAAPILVGGEGEMSWRVGVGADKRRMPNGTRKAKSRKVALNKDLARKTGKPEKAKS